MSLSDSSRFTILIRRIGWGRGELLQGDVWVVRGSHIGQATATPGDTGSQAAASAKIWGPFCVLILILVAMMTAVYLQYLILILIAMITAVHYGIQD